MTTPNTPSTSKAGDGVPSSALKASLDALAKKLSFQETPTGRNNGGIYGNGSSLPTTPAKLNEIDPAIVLSVKSRPRSHEQSEEKKVVDHRNVSTINTKLLHPGMTEASRTKQILITRNWRNDGDPFFAGPSTNLTQATTAVEPEFDGSAKDTKALTPKPREDRDNSQISSENAQGFFKATYCIFVANLAVGCADSDLEAETHKVFSRFGNLWTKIRRDRNGMPYAFCQYTVEADADKALKEGHGIMVCGRPCRVERAKANRSIYLSRTSGGAISEDQAREILNKQGPIEKLWYPTDTDKEVYRLPDGIWATFAFFQDARDAQNAFKDSKEYRLEIPYSPEDHERQRNSRYKYSPNHPTPLRGIRFSATRGLGAGSRLGGSVPNSIFVGNVPTSASMDSMFETFGTCGEIQTVEMIGRRVGAMPGLSSFAFVEYEKENGAKNALDREITFNGRRLRIEPRESQDQLSRARAFANNSPHVRGPYTPRTPAINNGDGNVKSGLSTTTPANPMMPIFENGHPGSTGHPQHPQTPSHQVFHHPYYYGSPYGPAYGAFAPPAFGDMGQMTAPVFPQMGNSPSGLGHGQYGYPGYYPQGYNGPQYYYHHPQSTPGEIPNNDSGPVNNTPATGTPAQGTTSPPPVNNESTS